MFDRKAYRERLKRDAIIRSALITIIAFTANIIVSSLFCKMNGITEIMLQVPKGMKHTLLEAIIEIDFANITFMPFIVQHLSLALIASIAYYFRAYQYYYNRKDTMPGVEEGSATFNEDYEGFALKYTYMPSMFTKITGPRYFIGLILYAPVRLSAFVRLGMVQALHKVFPKMKTNTLKFLSGIVYMGLNLLMYGGILIFLLIFLKFF